MDTIPVFNAATTAVFYGFTKLTFELNPTLVNYALIFDIDYFAAITAPVTRLNTIQYVFFTKTNCIAGCSRTAGTYECFTGENQCSLTTR